MIFFSKQFLIILMKRKSRE